MVYLRLPNIVGKEKISESAKKSFLAKIEEVGEFSEKNNEEKIAPNQSEEQQSFIESFKNKVVEFFSVD